MIRKAVIVAAGLSSRLYPRTQSLPKALLPVGNETLIERSVRILKDSGIQEILVVTGFEETQIKRRLLEKVSYQWNPFYAECNNLGSLWFAQSFVGSDSFLYLHSDIYFDEGLLSQLLETSETTLLIQRGSFDEEMMKVEVDSAGRFLRSSKKIPKEKSQGEWTGVAALHRPRLFFEAAEAVLKKDLQAYDVEALNLLTRGGGVVDLVDSGSKFCMEIDFEKDYQEVLRHQTL